MSYPQQPFSTQATTPPHNAGHPPPGAPFHHPAQHVHPPQQYGMHNQPNMYQQQQQTQAQAGEHYLVLPPPHVQCGSQPGSPQQGPPGPYSIQAEHLQATAYSPQHHGCGPLPYQTTSPHLVPHSPYNSHPPSPMMAQNSPGGQHTPSSPQGPGQPPPPPQYQDSSSMAYQPSAHGSSAASSMPTSGCPTPYGAPPAMPAGYYNSPHHAQQQQQPLQQFPFHSGAPVSSAVYTPPAVYVPTTRQQRRASQVSIPQGTVSPPLGSSVQLDGSTSLGASDGRRLSRSHNQSLRDSPLLGFEQRRSSAVANRKATLQEEFFARNPTSLSGSLHLSQSERDGASMFTPEALSAARERIEGLRRKWNDGLVFASKGEAEGNEVERAAAVEIELQTLDTATIEAMVEVLNKDEALTLDICIRNFGSVLYGLMSIVDPVHCTSFVNAACGKRLEMMATKTNTTSCGNGCNWARSFTVAFQRIHERASEEQQETMEMRIMQFFTPISDFPFGNYLAQLAVRSKSAEVRKKLIETLKDPQVFTDLATRKYSSRAVDAFFDVATDAEVNEVFTTFLHHADYFPGVVHNNFGNYPVQKALRRIAAVPEFRPILMWCQQTMEPYVATSNHSANIRAAWTPVA